MVPRKFSNTKKYVATGHIFRLKVFPRDQSTEQKEILTNKILANSRETSGYHLFAHLRVLSLMIPLITPIILATESAT